MPSKTRKYLFRFFEASVALFCLLFSHQIVWLEVRDYTRQLEEATPSYAWFQLENQPLITSGTIQIEPDQIEQMSPQNVWS